MTALSALTELAVPAAVSPVLAPAAERVNPLLPTGYDVAFSVIAVLILGLAVWALAVLVKRQNEVSLVEFFLWIAVILMFPLFGAGVYLLARGRGKRSERSAGADGAERARAE
ncbi:PLDc N-terminal domain-containing protein [Leucobacter sp. PH1c]|uniref:PLDc N-terminal domain-containing protein n=1 Tax=Leucobacter sp. PH1c TaxID=1397278 RepID=UPI00046AC80C|nr:PLDc N-terminal domain-containing protein [Leucobacter sp. PH1c]